MNRRLKALRRARLTEALASTVGIGLAIGLGIAACVVLVLKLVGVQAIWPAWTAFGVGLAAGLAGIPRAVRRRESEHALAARLDVMAGARGVVMAVAAQTAEERDAGWAERADAASERVVVPRPRLLPLLPALISLICVTVALAMPPKVAAQTEEPSAVQILESLEDRLDALKSAELLPEDEVKELTDRVEQLKENIRDTGITSAGWEGIDRLEKDMEQKTEATLQQLAQTMTLAKQAAKELSLETDEVNVKPDTGKAGNKGAQGQPKNERDRLKRQRDRLKRQRDRLKRKRELGQAGQQAQDFGKKLLDRLSRDRDRDLLERLGKSLSKLAERSPGAMPKLDRESRDALEKLAKMLQESGGLSEKELEQLLEQLQKQGGGSGGSGAKPLTAEDVKRLVKALEKQLGQGGKGKLEQMGLQKRLQLILVRLQGAGSGSGPGGSSGPGSGKPGKGGGSAELTHGKETTAEPGQDVALPQGVIVNPDGSIVLEVIERAPEVEPGAGPGPRAAERTHGPAKADAHRARVAPRHKGAVKRYFAPSSTPEPAPATPKTTQPGPN